MTLHIYAIIYVIDFKQTLVHQYTQKTKDIVTRRVIIIN